MNTAPVKVYEIVTPVVVGLGYELVGIQWLQQGRHSLLRIYIDHPNGIRLQDCEAVNRQLSAVFDVEDVLPGQYQLEVSSPGLDRPLFTLEQFRRFIGSEVSIRCVTQVLGQRHFKGVIAAVEDELIQLNREADSGTIDIPFAVIQKAHLVPDL